MGDDGEKRGAEVVNLRRARKAKDRAADKRRADANALEHGRSKAERRATATEAARVARVFEGHRRAGQGPEGQEGAEDQEGAKDQEGV